ncbi:hypothetical protein PENTCL1PPCAC_7670, partial [Pristionchus entomophagus]
FAIFKGVIRAVDLCTVPSSWSQKIRCDHLLRHHHCRTHRKECPERARREAEKTNEYGVKNMDEITGQKNDKLVNYNIITVCCSVMRFESAY